jgi:hypothetical protein
VIDVDVSGLACALLGLLSIDLTAVLNSNTAFMVTRWFAAAVAVLSIE